VGVEHEHRRAYRRRTPENSALHHLVASSLGPLRERLAYESPYGRGLPRYIERELEEYLRCGLLEHGFARVVCRACRAEHLVAFSCKRRGLCSSCNARRMFDTAAHLVDRVLPRIPIRQWVLTFSRQVRWHLAADPKLASEVSRRALRTVFSWQRRHARALGERPGRGNSCGAITFVQRFNSALELSYHLHILIPDGLFVSNGDGLDHPPRFVELAPPTDADVERLLGKIVRRTERHLRRRGRLDEEAETPELGPELFASQALPRPGRPFAEPKPPPPLCARQAGYSLHASTWIRASDRDGLERLCRYGLRPPLSVGRLEALPDGSYAYRMKRRYSDGREVLHFAGEALLLRLIALIPPPRTHLVRYAGIFAPRARGRDAVTGARRSDGPVSASSAKSLDHLPRVDLATLCRTPGPSHPTRARRLDWATLLRRSFALDVLVCPRCQGPMRLISVVESPAVIGKILAHLGLSVAPARAGPRLALQQGHIDALSDAFDGLDPPSPLD
jgi:hypothetical protein